jgi:hypothetical protein
MCLSLFNKLILVLFIGFGLLSCITNPIPGDPASITREQILIDQIEEENNASSR